MRGNRFANHASAIHVSIGPVGKIERKRETVSWYLVHFEPYTADSSSGAATLQCCQSLICFPHRCAKTIATAAGHRRPH